ncbi:uncharacterized protein A4U43_C09F1810 [Asparagus officinalis]|uniref:Uncharacterized protein n=1 Tax=Asparagus officinalis TaxID=4686 RepID=A0A5P1E9D1_ASPOF|nr:uncharacterized protein A4U43_C09F1810 [Asparagus officinalis]
MEMRARDDTPTAQDLIPSTPRSRRPPRPPSLLPLPPPACSRFPNHPRFLLPHVPLLSYCSLTCHPLRPRPSTTPTGVPPRIAPLNVSLRRLRRPPRRTPPPPNPGPARRVGSRAVVENLEAGSRIRNPIWSPRIREGAAVMRRARERRGRGGGEEVLWAVLTRRRWRCRLARGVGAGDWGLWAVVLLVQSQLLAERVLSVRSWFVEVGFLRFGLV